MALRRRLDVWLEDAVARQAPLEFRDLRKGVQSLSTLYVEARPRSGGRGAKGSAGELGRRSRESPARRGAFATYYAALHALTVLHALREHPVAGPIRRVVDLGCGTGAAGLGVALSQAAGPEAEPELLGVDRSGWALGEARRSWAALGLRGRTRRSTLPALPRLGAGDLVVLGWVLNECDDATRERVAKGLAAARERGAAVLVAEPLAGFVAPWWDAFAERLAPAGLEARLWKAPVALPAWVEKMDRAAGLDHAELGARLLLGPPA